jgi:hypothetical protein
MRKLIVVATALAAMAIPATAGADNHASCNGAAHGAFANVNGNFGWLGQEGGAAGYHGVVGQTPGATGYNNSHVDCS